ncbi:hypothetical protein FRC01_005399 [Tulasnella sp. 417]|nr:hypothetical protein FRC01_005399 [Tulasnella sp. 417]
MSAALLSKRLDRALDAAQYFTQVFPNQSEDADGSADGEGVKAKVIDFAGLPTWTGKKLGLSLGRQSFKERAGLEEIERKEREETMGKIELPPNLDPFYTLRSLVLVLGQEVDRESKEVVFVDAESGHAVFIKIIEVREASDDTPLLVVQFRLDTKSPGREYAFWKYASTSQLIRVECPNRALILLHRLLLLNSNRAAPTGDGSQGAGLKPSFILTIGPIEKSDIAQLARDLSCAVVLGFEQADQPYGFHLCFVATPYCSRECQMQHWTTHKKTCNSLTGATWSVMPFSNANPFGFKFSEIISLSGGGRAKDSTKESPAEGEEDKAPPNEHGDNPFLIKVQYNGSPFIMVYDRTRALETHLNRNDNPRVFDQIAALVREKGFMGMKIYVWAKRTADWELSLALDKIPSQNVPW